MTPFLLGILATACTFAPLAIYMLHGWKRAMSFARIAIAKWSAAENERHVTAISLIFARAEIERLTPLAETGRKRRAASEKYKAKGRGK